MSILKNRKKFLIILSLVFGFSILSSRNSHHFQENKNGYLESDIEQKLKKAGYWELSPIFIDDDNPAYNWSITAATYDWCRGSGTWSDPYIIENITIDGGHSDDGIIIENCNVYFIIRNVTVYHSGNSHHEAGIVLNSVSKGSLTDNIFSDNFHGIFLGNSNNNTITGNILTDNSHQSGIRLRDNSNNNTISDNKIFNNEWGILLEYGSNYNIISGNNASYHTSGAGIVIQASSHYNIIKNNSMFYNKNGILLSGCIGSIISENKAYFNSIRGIAIWSGSNDNNISGNFLSNNEDEGIESHDSHYNQIHNNTLSHNPIGIRMGQSLYNIILSNKIHDNDEGITFMDGSKNNTISNNFIINNKAIGINIDEEDADNQTILNNIIENNTIGIKISDSKNNIILSNKIHNNDEYGIFVDKHLEPHLDPVENNLIYKNNFTNPTGINAIDNGINNRWDNGILGNYWDNYSGKDTDDDGIGDTPYIIDIANETKDNFPLWWDPPVINIYSPNTNEIFDEAPQFNISIDEGIVNTTWYSLDGGLTNIPFTGTTGYIHQTEWNNRVDGPVTIQFFVNDSKGYIGFKDIYVEKDMIAPKITLNSPVPYQLSGVDAPSFSLTIDEPNIQTKLYSINERSNITFTTQTQFSQSEWNTAGNGTVSIIFYIIDKVGNSNSSEVIVRKDAYIPDITIFSPTPDEIFGITTPDFNISIIEEDLVSRWYIVQGNITQYPFTGKTGTIDQVAWNGALEGQINITFYAQDRAGNIGTETVIVIKRIPSHPSISGYNLFILLGVLSVAIIMIERKWRNLRG